MKEKVNKIVQFIIFLCILLFVFTRITYLFREVSLSRDNVTGFEKEGELDVVCIGASTMVEYYQPLTAWNEYGYTSYVYGTLYGQIELFWRYMDRVLKTHEPKLFVVDLRMLTTLTDEGIYEQGVRFWADSLPVLAPARYLSLHDYFKMRSLSGEEKRSMISYYIDIMKYHTNDSALASPENWKYMDNKGYAQYKGYTISSAHQIFEKPIVNVEEKAELTQIQEQVLCQLLDYCKKKELNVLFVVCPYMVSEEEQKAYNTMKDIVTSYGYHYINANEYYDEIGIDFQADMKNTNHLNCVGAEKYTGFLADYIMKNYEIATHRGEEDYVQWDIDYKNFAQELKKEKESVYKAALDKGEAVILAQKLAEADNIYEWASGAKNSNYSLIVCADLSKCNLENVNTEGKQLLDNWGIDPARKNYYLRVSCGDNIIYLEEQAEALECVVDGFAQSSCKVTINDAVILKIGNVEYTLKGNGIKLFLFDNNHKKLADSMILQVDNSGVVRREKLNIVQKEVIAD